MKKDVIYIDIEDDITSIIEKVKSANATIVALVPPKRIGALQSVVNLKLLNRAAGTVDKRIVLITSNQALSSLAAGVSIPVAKNLQTKPELANVEVLEIDDEDIINGDELPVGDLAATAPPATSSFESPKPTTAPKVTTSAAAAAAANAPKKGSRVPNFERFRKKMFLIIAGVVLLLAFLIWAIFFSAQATVKITARTTPYDVNQSLALSAAGKLDAKKGVSPAQIETIRKTNTIDFDATGKKDVGVKAMGTISLSNCLDSDPIFVPAGSRFTTASGLQFVSAVDVTIPDGKFIGGICTKAGTGEVDAIASEIGEQYNVGAQSLVSNDVTISASFASATSGGSKRQTTVVAAEDVEKAKGQLTAQDANQVKTDLKKRFAGSTIVINESFHVNAAEPAVAPAIGAEAGRAKLTAETTYTMLGVTRDNLKKIFEASINDQLDGAPNQRIYDSGINSIRFNEFAIQEDGNYSVKVITTSLVGPSIDEAKLAKDIVGKRAGEIQAQVEDVDGVEAVDVNFSPFWVTKAPDAKKITITFLVKNEAD